MQRVWSANTLAARSRTSATALKNKKGKQAMRKPLEISLRLKLFFWFMVAGVWSLLDPDFGHKIVKSYDTQLEKEKAEKINKLHL